MVAHPECPLCTSDAGELVWRGERARVVLAEEPAFPGFTRVIWAAHRAEMTDLAPADRALMMNLVWCVERAQRDLLRADKINLASFGNQVAHLHWHVIPRWSDDSHFPAAVWAVARREGEARRLRAATLVAGYREALAARLEELAGA